MENKEGSSVGEAYGFFRSNASKKEIETELTTIYDIMKTPSQSQLELSLIEGMDNVKGDGRLTTLAQEAKEKGINFMLKAKYSDKTNADAAFELVPILNQTYQSPLYEVGEPYRGEIVSEANGDYAFAA